MQISRLSAPPRPAQGATQQLPATPRHHDQDPVASPSGSYPDDGGLWWLSRLPGRILAFLGLVTVPVRALALILDMAVSVCVLSVVATGWAWWTGRITDEQVAQVLGTLGDRMLAILSKSGVL